MKIEGIVRISKFLWDRLKSAFHGATHREATRRSESQLIIPKEGLWMRGMILQGGRCRLFRYVTKQGLLPMAGVMSGRKDCKGPRVLRTTRTTCQIRDMRALQATSTAPSGRVQWSWAGS